jgi:hypothetical protein
MSLESTLPSFIRTTNGEDLLEGKSQERIANSLSQLIQDDTSKQKLIGLEGPWGSGKSNLISILKAKLNDTHHLYIHDAWGHQEDLQRRAFLEELTENLCQEGLLEPEKWSKKLADLLARKQKTTTTITPQLSMGIVLTVLIALATPLFKLLTDFSSKPYLKFLIAASPFLGLVLFWTNQSRKNKSLLGLNDLFYIYKEKELENTTTTLTFEEEPSVRQFRGWMDELSADLTKKLIIVFDNMDRLPAIKVQALWSSINTFYSDYSFDKIWVIIPFDRAHIAEAFKDGVRESNGDQFISKTFSVIYKVGMPVLTDWHKFFKLKFDEAFGEMENKELIPVRSVFDLMQTTITPRQIISFLNEMVTIKRVVLNEIDLRYIALYLLAKKDIDLDPVRNILSLDFVKPCRRIFSNDDKVQEAIAALVYNVPISSASQVILQREMQVSVRDLDITRFKELSQHVHFLDIMEKMNIEGELDIVNLIELLNELSVDFHDTESNKSQLNRIWANLNIDVISTVAVEQEFTNANKIILQKSTESNKQLHLHYIVDGLYQIENIDGALYFRAFDELDNFLKEKFDTNLPDLLTEHNIEPSAYLQYIIEGDDKYNRYKIVTKNKALNDYLITEIDGGAFISEKINRVINDYDFSETINHLESLISDDKVSIETFENVYTLYKAITKKKPLQILSDENIYKFFSEIDETSSVYADLIAMWIIKVGTKSPHTRLDRISGAADEQLAERISKIIEHYKTYHSLLTTTTPNNTPLLTAVIKNITEMPPFTYSALNIELTLQRFGDICNEFGLDAIAFIKKLNYWLLYAYTDINKNNISQSIKDILFYEAAVNLKNGLTEHIISVFKQSLKPVSKESWFTHITTESFIFDVFYLLMTHDKIKTIPTKFIEAFKTILTEYSAGSIAPVTIAKWEFISNAINWSLHQSTVKNIRDSFIQSGNISNEQFIFFFSILIKYGDLKVRSGDVTRTIFSRVMNNSVCFDLLVKNRVLVAPIIVNSQQDGQEFREFLKRHRTKDVKDFITLTGGKVKLIRKK